MSAPIPPHGGQLIDRRLTGAAREAALERAQRLPRVALNEVALADLEMIAVGALSPLMGFMTRADYLSVRDQMRLASGLPWGLPVTLTVHTLDRLRAGREVALTAGDQPLAILELEEVYELDPLREAQQVYRTTDPAHPGVARLFQQGRMALGGAVHVIDLPRGPFPALRLTPAQTRAEFAARGWRRIVAFQTRNPIHRAHEYMHKVALEIVDGLLLHPLVGETKADDVPADVRIASYRALLATYYPADRVLLAAFPAAMRYAGPREAIWHAIARKNYGCTHIIIGRDHAGLGSYYGSYDAQRIFDEFTADEIGITPLFFEHTFYCRACASVVSRKTCPHDSSCHVALSGTQVRAMLARGEAPPPEVTRPEVAAVLLEAMRRRNGV